MAIIFRCGLGLKIERRDLQCNIEAESVREDHEIAGEYSF